MESKEISSYERFQELLEKNGVTAYKVAKETGVTTATITSWKQGKYIPKIYKMEKIANFLGTTVDFILEGKDNKKSVPTYNKAHLELIKIYDSLPDKKKESFLDIVKSISLLVD